MTLLVGGRIPVLDDTLLDVATLARVAVFGPERAVSQPGDRDVALVVLDERSLDSEPLRGRPRALLAPELGQLLDGLVDAGARAVAFDVIFRYSGNRLSAGYDRPFLQALYRHRGRVVLGRGRERREVPLAPYLGALGPARGSLGLTELRADADGVVREIHVAPLDSDGAPTLTLAGAALELAGETELPQTVRLGRKRHLEYLPTYAVVDVLRCIASPAGRDQLSRVFGGRVVFVGTSLTTEDRVPGSTRHLPRPETGNGPSAPACGLEPMVASARDAVTVPGVFLHAAAAQAVLAGDTLVQAPAGFSAALAAAAAIVGFALTVVMRRLSGILWTALLGAVCVGAGVALLELGLWLPPSPLVAAAVSAMLIGYLTQYVLEGRRREAIQHAFGRYLAPSVVERLLDDGEELRLGGDLRDITVMFADLSGFTAMSARVPPEELVELTNRYLALIVAAVDETNGYVDKFIGDAVMALWGAPMHDTAHPSRAVEAALRIAERVAEAAADGSAGERFGIKIGLESGEAIVGNVGSEHRYNYTAVGKTVNIASRLEGLPGLYGCRTVIGPTTHDRVHERVLCRELDLVVVKGNDRPIRIYEPMAHRGSETPEQRALAGDYAVALAAYRARRFDEAVARWRALAVSDGPARVMAEAAARLSAEPPPPDWDGSLRLTSK